MSGEGERPRLGTAAPAALAAAVQRPAFDRDVLDVGIVHLGIGAFARAHLLPVNDAAIAASVGAASGAAGGGSAWGVAGVSLRHAGTRDALAPQDGLYSLSLRDAGDDGAPREQLQIVGSLRRLAVAPEEPTVPPRLIAAPATRIVSLTVTEKGYRASDASPLSAAGCIAHGLRLRRAAGLGGVTLMSLDNLPGNGDALRLVVLDAAQSLDAALATWIDTHCTFPCSMVDRIVPRTTDADRERIAAAIGAVDAWPVVGEPFLDWAVEDRFAAGRPDWSAGGARFVQAAAPFEALKLRMVNGSHSALAYLGCLAGLATVDEALRTPALRGFVDALMRDEVEPTLASRPGLAGVDIAAYRARLLARFANPALQHRLSQIAMDGSQKLPQRWLATARERLAAGLRCERLALGIAAWQRYLRGADERDHAHAIDDPLADAMRAELAAHGSLLGFVPVFGDLVGDERFAAAVRAAAADLDRLGALGAAAAYIERR